MQGAKGSPTGRFGLGTMAVSTASNQIELSFTIIRSSSSADANW